MRLPPNRWINPACLAFLVLLLGGCGQAQSQPSPTPADFPGLVEQLAREGIAIEDVVAGDAGCADPDLSKAARSFKISGLGQATPVKVILFRFRNRSSFEKLRDDATNCVRAVAKDPSTFELFEISPFVLAGQGPWTSDLHEHVERALTEAAGSGG